MKRETCEHCGGDAIVGTTCPRSLPCSLCKAAPGARCKRPSGHVAAELHATRIIEAERLDQGAGIVPSFDPIPI